MVTYPSTHGVFETTIREICEIVHAHGGQVYMDGANMNAQVGLCRPGDIGADVCHLNLHKTFCIPHGGGGPGVGPIGVAEASRAVSSAALHSRSGNRPNRCSANGEHGKRPPTGERSMYRHGGGTGGNVSAAPYGSASILTISWMYIRMMGPRWPNEATEVAILNANYIAKRLDPLFPRSFQRQTWTRRARMHPGFAPMEKRRRRSGRRGQAPDGLRISRADGFVAGRRNDDDRANRERIETGARPLLRRDDLHPRRDRSDRERKGWIAQNNVLKNAPHTAQQIASDKWERPYSREQAAYPAPWTREHKFWPAVARIDNVYGDRNLFCSCPPMEEFEV